MNRSGRWVASVLLFGCMWALAACGNDELPSVRDRPIQATAYDPDRPLPTRVVRRWRDATATLTRFTYPAPDGERVPALLTVPLRRPALGCVVILGPLGTTNEATAELRRALAQVRLASFVMEPRFVGQRGTRDDLDAAIARPEGVRDLLLDTVAELRTGIDYLERRTACKRGIVFMGTAFGAAAGTIAAAQDRRIKGAMLTSLGATLAQQLLIRPIAAERVPSLPPYVPTAASDPVVLARATRILSPYDPERWIGKIAPRRVMLLVGRSDPSVVPGDAMQLMDAARQPRTLLYYNGAQDPFAEGPAQRLNFIRAGRFLSDTLGIRARALR